MTPPGPSNAERAAARGLADTVARLLNESRVGWFAGGCVDDGPLCAKLYVTSENGVLVAITFEKVAGQ